MISQGEESEHGSNSSLCYVNFILWKEMSVLVHSQKLCLDWCIYMFPFALKLYVGP